MTSKSILEELEEIGAIGKGSDEPNPSVTVTFEEEEDAPAVVPANPRNAALLECCERVLQAMEQWAAAQQGLLEHFEQMYSLLTEEVGTSEEEVVEDSDEPVEDVQEELGDEPVEEEAVEHPEIPPPPRRSLIAAAEEESAQEEDDIGSIAANALENTYRELHTNSRASAEEEEDNEEVQA